MHAVVALSVQSSVGVFRLQRKISQDIQLRGGGDAEVRKGARLGNARAA